MANPTIVPVLAQAAEKDGSQLDAAIAAIDALVTDINEVTFSDAALVAIIFVGVVFTIWTGFGQLRALTHGIAIVRGKFDDKDDPGAINHFQALSTALSGTVGLGNIAGVALAISLGGPGAILWMWLIGFLGMAIKMTEVTQAMLTRDISNPKEPRGGTMFMLQRTLAVGQPDRQKRGLVAGACVGVMGIVLAIGTGNVIVIGALTVVAAVLVGLGWAATGVLSKIFSTLFCVAVLLTAATGGNMFQAYSVADITESNYNVPPVASGIVLTIIVGAVILGGIHRIGAVTGRLVPFMCLLYLLAGLWVVAINIEAVPGIFAMIIRSGLPEWAGGSAASASGPFLGAAVGTAFTLGLKRALFSSEAGWGSAPMAHSAAKTDEPVREGIVAGLEPFVDTIVVCTVTALVLLLSGTYDRTGEAAFPEDNPARIVMFDADGDGEQDLADTSMPLDADNDGTQDTVMVPVDADKDDKPDVDDDGNPVLEEKPAFVKAPIWTVQSPAELPRMRSQARQSRSVGESDSGWSGIDRLLMVIEVALPEPVPDDLPDAERPQAEARGYILDRSRQHAIARVLTQTSDTDDAPPTRYMPEWSDEKGKPFTIVSLEQPTFISQEIWAQFQGASLTGYAFDRVTPGLGKTLITLAVWLFAISTIISWNYYGEQATTFAFGRAAVWPYRVIYCLIVLVAAAAEFETSDALDNWSTLGYGIMIAVNIPLMIAFGPMAMRAYHDYLRRMKSGEMDPPHEAPNAVDVVEGRDVK